LRRRSNRANDRERDCYRERERENHADAPHKTIGRLSFSTFHGRNGRLAQVFLLKPPSRCCASSPEASRSWMMPDREARHAFRAWPSPPGPQGRQSSPALKGGPRHIQTSAGRQTVRPTRRRSPDSARHRAVTPPTRSLIRRLRARRRGASGRCNLKPGRRPRSRAVESPAGGYRSGSWISA
jgi:hypothetical protein